jgi:hypothetical protein
MKQKIVGHYYIGHECVQLVATEGGEGSLYFTPEYGKVPRIKVGVDYDDYQDALEVLLHEVYEFALTREGTRHLGTDTFTEDHTQYLFVMTHCQFSNITSKCSVFLTEALPEFKKAWAKWHKKKGK